MIFPLFSLRTDVFYMEVSFNLTQPSNNQHIFRRFISRYSAVNQPITNHVSLKHLAFMVDSYE